MLSWVKFVALETFLTEIDNECKKNWFLPKFKSSVSARNITVKSDYITVGRHIGPVWDITWDPTVKWEVEEPHIISAGSDGRITTWNVTPWNTFEHNDIATLQSIYSISAVETVPQDPFKEPLFDKATTIEFRPLDNFSTDKVTLGAFLVGTEEGWIHLCNARLNTLQFVKFQKIRYFRFLSRIY